MIDFNRILTQRKFDDILIFLSGGSKYIDPDKLKFLKEYYRKIIVDKEICDDDYEKMFFNETVQELIEQSEQFPEVFCYIPMCDLLFLKEVLGQYIRIGKEKEHHFTKTAEETFLIERILLNVLNEEGLKLKIFEWVYLCNQLKKNLDKFFEEHNEKNSKVHYEGIINDLKNEIEL